MFVNKPKLTLKTHPQSLPQREGLGVDSFLEPDLSSCALVVEAFGVAVGCQALQCVRLFAVAVLIFDAAKVIAPCLKS